MDKIEENKLEDTINMQQREIQESLDELQIEDGTGQNPRIRQKVDDLINQRGEEPSEMDDMDGHDEMDDGDEDKDGDDDAEGSADEDCIITDKQLLFNPVSQLNKWLKSRGKQHCINFEDEELIQLRNYFNSLDDDGSGSIGVDELEDPLIALGLVDNRQQVQKIV